MFVFLQMHAVRLVTKLQIVLAMLLLGLVESIYSLYTLIPLSITFILWHLLFIHFIPLVFPSNQQFILRLSLLFYFSFIKYLTFFIFDIILSILWKWARFRIHIFIFPIWRVSLAIFLIKYFLYVVPICEIFHE